MNLLEAADVNPDADRWLNYLGLNRTARECGVWIMLTDPCADTSGNIVGTGTSRAGTYITKPFFYEARLSRSAVCELPDDGKWVEQALRDANDTVIGRALVTQAIVGTESYTGHADVKSVTLTATSDATIASSVAAGRKLWMEQVAGAGERPLMHVPPSLAPALVRGGVILATGDKNVWGDKIVISAGYDNAAPRVFFTGPVKVYLTTIDGSEQTVRNVRMNDSVISVNEAALVDVPPCSIVRVGAYS
jgi:hypothetical protein